LAVIALCYTARMTNALDQIFRERRLHALLADAEFLRDYPACDERIEQARLFLRQVMLDSAFGSVTAAERTKLFEILQGVAEISPWQPNGTDSEISSDLMF
jgi:hypothetical protein